MAELNEADRRELYALVRVGLTDGSRGCTNPILTE